MTAIYKGLTYQFCAGDGDSGNHLFVLKKHKSGYTQLRLAGPLDYESMQSPVVTIRVRVTDSRNKTFEKKITLNVLDVLERPENLEVDIVMLGAGGGGGAQDDGNGAPGGSGGQYAFSTTIPYSGRYAFIIGSGGKGGLHTSLYSTTGGPGGEMPSGINFVTNGGQGGEAGRRGSSGGGGGGGAATQFANFTSSQWQLLAAAGAGGGGTGRRELPAHPGGKGGNSNAVRPDGGGGPGWSIDGGADGPGGGGGGGGLLGGGGARRRGFLGLTTNGSIGGSSGKDSGFTNITNTEEIEGIDGGVFSGSYTYHGRTSPTEIGLAAGKWWDGLFVGGVGQGGYSGSSISDRSFSNGGSGAAIIRYKSDTMHSDGWPRLKVGGTHQILNGYHVHYFNQPGLFEFSLDLYE